jgi:fructokinase
MDVRTGVDLGGTKIEAVVLDDAGGVLARQRTPTPPRDLQATIDAIVQLVNQVETQAGARAQHVGVGGPGSPSPATGIHRNANSTVLNDQPLARLLQGALGREVRLANDANCLALSEAFDGAGEGHRCVFGVILGTGVGGGIVIDGQLHSGRNLVGGEFGHTALPRPSLKETPGPRCWCGHHGCLETWLSGPAIARLWVQDGHAPLQATELAVLDTPSARDHLERWLDRLARALANAINLLDPDIIVLGGGLSSIDAIYATMPGRLETLVFGGSSTTPLVKAMHGDSSGVLGAARL